MSTRLYAANPPEPRSVVDTGCIIGILEGYAMITSRNHATDEMTLKTFRTYDEAVQWAHADSKKQLPHWHREYCTHPDCAEEEGV